jgi:GT2 family glycosyltransferase
LSLNLNDIQKKYSYIDSDLLPGRGVLIPISAFLKIGLYDAKKFPHYTADADFSLRARQAGYKLVISPDSIVHSHYKETNLFGRHKSRNLNYWYQFFFSIRSSCNVRDRYNWAIKHGKIPVLYFMIDIARIFVSQIRSTHLAKSNS